METLINNVLINGNDSLLSVREKVITEDLIQPKNGVAQFILDFIFNILEGKEHNV